MRLHRLTTARRTCAMKVRYKSRHAAAAVIERCRKRRMGLTKAHRPYQCPRCFGWHIGHTS